MKDKLTTLRLNLSYVGQMIVLLLPFWGVVILVAWLLGYRLDYWACWTVVGVCVLAALPDFIAAARDGTLFRGGGRKR